ncbi:class I SAM-dependent methyltransferase [Paraglaciecola sp. 2405UD69-4]|uniref:class I SAM-dependent methyltransferase n=1 Tax=Paraglaciecola sp. 2405UD69-4 TaxID=3391836 RepID=UPI0039C8CE08
MLNTFQQSEHPMLVQSNHDQRARQEFVKSLKQHIQQGLLPSVQSTYNTRAVNAYTKKHQHPPKDYRQAREAFQDDPIFKAYLSVNRISQELQWFSVIDALDDTVESLEQTAKKLPAAGGSLQIPEQFTVPKYISELDIHCMPGGYCGPKGASPLHAGALYDRGVYLYAMGYMGPNNDDMGRSVCNYITRNNPDFKPKRILDMGCTVGHSTLPYAEFFPDAEVHAIDVSEACVTYGHHRAEGMGVPIHFKQANAEATDYEDGSFDLIVSHILLHETSKSAMPKIFQECHRLLKDGGLMIHADLPPFDEMDAYTQLILDNETWFNNEPFWTAMRNTDQIALAIEAGFAKDKVKFDNAPMAIMEIAAAAESYSEEMAEDLADREFTAGEYAPGGGWEVLVGQK